MNQIAFPGEVNEISGKRCKSGFEESKIKKYVEEHLKTVSYERLEREDIENCGICFLDFDDLELVK